MNFATLTPGQIRRFADIKIMELPMEQFTKTVITIPNWDKGHNQQQYVKQVDGSWIDCYNECYVSEEFVMARAKEHNIESGG
jgi:hypothetical protein